MGRTLRWPIAGCLQAITNNILSNVALGFSFMDNFRKHMSASFISTLELLATFVQQYLTLSRPDFLILITDTQYHCLNAGLVTTFSDGRATALCMTLSILICIDKNRS